MTKTPIGSSESPASDLMLLLYTASRPTGGKLAPGSLPLSALPRRRGGRIGLPEPVREGDERRRPLAQPLGRAPRLQHALRVAVGDGADLEERPEDCLAG